MDRRWLREILTQGIKNILTDFHTNLLIGKVYAFQCSLHTQTLLENVLMDTILDINMVAPNKCV